MSINGIAELKTGSSFPLCDAGNVKDCMPINEVLYAWELPLSVLSVNLHESLGIRWVVEQKQKRV